MNSAGAASFLIAILSAGQVLAQAPVLPADSGANAGKLLNRNGLPNLGDGSDMTLGAERRLGDRIARSLYRDLDYVDDPVISDYLQGIWQPLLAAARERGELPADMDEAYAWEIWMSRDRTVNAFALPGAYFGMHLGLIATVSNHAELASVMAHELSHVTQRHISRMMSRQSAQAPWMIGAMILGVLAASKSIDGANAMIMGGQAAAAQTQLNFNRDMEREADRVGYLVATQAGYAPQGFVTMFEKLQQASKLTDNTNFPYLRSHPLSTERMADMQSRIPQGIGGPTVLVPLEMDHAMVSARARVLSKTAVDALLAWNDEAKPAALQRLPLQQQAGVLYGATLAAAKLRDAPQAQALLRRLEMVVKDDTAARNLARLLAAEIQLMQGNPAQALVLLQQSPGATEPAASPAAMQEVAGQPPMPALVGRAKLFFSAQAATQSGAPKTEALQDWVANHPRDAQAWQLLAHAYVAQARPISAIRAEAEASVAQMDYAAALARLRSAQDQIRADRAGVDHIEASIVDTRARQIDVLAREQALER
ncbi:MAG: peptidase M48 [Burkholderiales bacterium PBB3]|nr:MAG: peptidase M48 [Burkholderiales bacterium PBB3]